MDAEFSNSTSIITTAYRYVAVTRKACGLPRSRGTNAGHELFLLTMEFRMYYRRKARRIFLSYPFINDNIKENGKGEEGSQKE